ncbi:MAG: sodium:proton antiporter [Immundisolibacter sp.]|uniref:sodium:proton antiporter n=1 Tax=Immundisolibacter sp. TaxID=1934948 RepID=UPI003D116E82
MTVSRVTLLLGLLLPLSAHAAEFDGAALGAVWALPFAGMLLSIALWPLIAPHVWHMHYGKITAVWALAFLLPFAGRFGLATAGAGVVHALLAEYLPFIILLTALYTVAGGIVIRGNLHGSPRTNTTLLAIGTALASVMGTTGASMLMIRPLLRANDNRRHRTHVVVFFIFLVSNVGGSLTPLGDPPLFLGFLQGVGFFWTAEHLWAKTVFMSVALLAIFYAIDRYWYAKEDLLPVDPTPDTPAFGVDGRGNIALMLAISGCVLMSGLWQPGIAWDVFGTKVALPQLARDLALLAIAGASLQFTPRALHAANQFSWAPLKEVAKLFLGIFATIIPVIAMLRAGADGPFAAVVDLVTSPTGEPLPAMYFWATGVLSAFLDNAPTYLVFFNLAGGDAQHLMTALAPVLVGISAGSVFMGAMTYIGNAPNLMVATIALNAGVKMPAFFGYLAWSCAVLLPLFAVVTWVWMR